MLKEYKNWGKDFRIEFSIEVSKMPEVTWTNVFHFTAHGNVGNIGDRIPALWIHLDGFFYFCTIINSRDECKFVNFELGRQHHVIIEQSKNSVGISIYSFQIQIDGNFVWSRQTTQPKIFPTVKLYASDPWHGPFSADLGSICNVKIEDSEL